MGYMGESGLCCLLWGVWNRVGCVELRGLYGLFRAISNRGAIWKSLGCVE